MAGMIAGAAIGGTIGFVGGGLSNGDWDWGRAWAGFAIGTVVGGAIGAGAGYESSLNSWAGGTGYTGFTMTPAQEAATAALPSATQPAVTAGTVVADNADLIFQYQTLNSTAWGMAAPPALTVATVGEGAAALVNVAQSAYSFAQTYLGQNAYTNRCSEWVRTVYGQAGAQLQQNFANDFETDPHLFETNNPQPGDIVQFDRGTGQLPHGHVAVYSGNGNMISTSSRRIGPFPANARAFNIQGNPALRYLTYR